MQTLRNLPLAARLGVAFGALAVGLLVVTVVAFRATDGLGSKVDALAVDVPRYTELVDGIAARLPEEAHLTVRHLYVFDGDLKAQDEVTAQFEKLVEQDEAAFAGMVQVLSTTGDAASIEAADDVEQLQRSHDAFIDATRETLDVSREETVDARRGARRVALRLHRRARPDAQGALHGRHPDRGGHDGLRRRRGREGAQRDQRHEARDPDRRAGQRADRADPRRLDHPLGRAARSARSAGGCSRSTTTACRRSPPASRPARTAT